MDIFGLAYLQTVPCQAVLLHTIKNNIPIFDSSLLVSIHVLSWAHIFDRSTRSLV
jgi:hypothetical protein